jgi:alkylation response protein AidB-like acyl-CoA dehydrogenase
MQAALQMTLDYVRLRRQFGRPIGSFQALQHRLVDLHIQAQLATACVDDVLARHDGGDIDLFSISRMKSRCSEAALYITRQAIQLHGAIGYTEEHNIGLYLKRSIVLSAWLGTASEHRGLAAKFVSREWGVAS